MEGTAFDGGISMGGVGTAGGTDSGYDDAGNSGVVMLAISAQEASGAVVFKRVLR